MEKWNIANFKKSLTGYFALDFASVKDGAFSSLSAIKSNEVQKNLEQ